jgi:uncharacterized protein (TIGR03437 family)
VRSKFILWGVLLLTQLSFSAQATISSVLNGASYQTTTAPDSWAVAFGNSMAPSTAAATLTAAGQWPTTLAGITIQVDGQLAELYYVSPSQIDFLVPDGTTFGTLSVVITNVASGATQTSSIIVQNTAVGLFSTAASGAGPGAILNGVTYAAAPFLVETPQNGGADLRTRLAVYCTGLRWSGNLSHDASDSNVAASVTAQGLDTAGNRYNFTVEYAGAAPGYIGLDQVNIVLPANLDGAGVVSLTIDTDTSASNVVSFLVNALPATSIRLTSLALSTGETTGGTTVIGTVALNGRAQTGGFPVSLRSNLASVSVPSVVTVPQGQASTTFNIPTPSTAAVQTATVTATASASTQTATLQIDPSTLAQLGSFTVGPASVQGGANLTGTIGLTQTAALGGVAVQLASDNAAAQPPASVTVQGNSTSSTFTIPTSVVTSPQTVDITASLGSNSQTATVTVVPALQLTLSAAAVTGGASLTATVTLGTVAPAGGTTLTIASSAVAVAQASGTVTIPAGQNTATATITTYAVTAARTVTITASSVVGLSATATLTVNPPTPGTLESVSVTPTQVTGGANATGTITLTGPAPTGGIFVTVSTSNILTAQAAPSLVQVTQGQTTATFNITTSKVATSQTVVITAKYGSISQTAVLTVE